jgi:hypothetical protein
MNVDLSELRRLARKGSEGTNSMNQFTSNAEGVTASLASDRSINVNSERRKGETVIVVADMFTESKGFYTLAQSMEWRERDIPAVVLERRC